jgi:hypothetical protein
MDLHLEPDPALEQQLQRQRRAEAVWLYTQQLGVAHLRCKAAAAAPG